MSLNSTCSQMWRLFPAAGHHRTILSFLASLSEGRALGTAYNTIHPPSPLCIRMPLSPHDTMLMSLGPLPAGFLDQDGPEDVLQGYLLLPARRLHKRVQGGQREALLVQLQQLVRQIPQRS